MLGTPGDFLMRRKSPKTHQGPPGPWTPGEGGVAPFDPPALCPSGIGCDSLNPQASSMASLPSHGLKTESVPLMEPKQKIRPVCPPAQSGKSVFFCGRNPSPARAGTACGASAKRAVTTPSGDSKGRSPWRAFGDFPRVGKVTRGAGRSACTSGSRSQV